MKNIILQNTEVVSNGLYKVDGLKFPFTHWGLQVTNYTKFGD